MANRMALGLHKRIREEREKAGIAIGQMAAWLGIHHSVYRKIEDGAVGVTAERVVEIARLLHCSAGSLLGENAPAAAS